MVACELSKPLYGLSTPCKDWYRTVRNLLSEECGGKATSLGESVFFRTHRNFKYEYERDFRDKIRGIRIMGYSK